MATTGTDSQSRGARLAAHKYWVERWFANQMGMTVLQWREAQANAGYAKLRARWELDWGGVDFTFDEAFK